MTSRNPAEPTEPARGPTFDARAHANAADGLPPFEKSAAVAFAGALLPYLCYAGTVCTYLVAPLSDDAGSGLQTMLWIGWSMVSSVGSLVGPIVGFVVGGRTAKRLRAIHEEERPRGLAMAVAARWIGLATLVLWALMFGVAFVAVGTMKLD